MTSIFRIHPAINIARIGSSQEIYIAPETAAGEKVDDAGLFGGLPTKPGTEADFITEDDLRDKKGEVKRQAARFRIFAYPGETPTYPSGEGVEITLGGKVDGKTVTDILWTVHLANKKLNNYAIGPNGLAGYKNLATVPIRNGNYPNVPPQAQTPGSPQSVMLLNDTMRLQQLVIDPGPRAMQAANAGGQIIAFDQNTPASFFPAKSTAPTTIPNYPKSFPSTFHKNLEVPLGPIDSLGDMRVEAKTGRLIVAGGFGHTVGVIVDGKAPPLTDPTENGLWFDDTSCGPVDATLVFDDGSMQAAVGAWVVTGDPGYAPQTRNVVSAWDDIYDTWVRELGLIPGLFSNGSFQTSFQPSFPDEVQPIFHAAMLQRWNTNLPQAGIDGHNMIGAIKPTDDPTVKIPNLTGLIRNPTGGDVEIQTGLPLMPLSLGDTDKSFLTVSQTQYFFLTQWHNKAYMKGPGPKLGPGERLDRVVLENCLGGRYSPGIEVSFSVRDTHLYNTADVAKTGPFRVNAQPLDYSKIQAGTPFLTAGYIPLQNFKAEPGDVSKLMSVPWHTDYNSCAVHLPSPNPNLVDGAGQPQPNNVLFWSWPAERPVQVHPKALCTYDAKSETWTLGGQVFSIRGDGTETPYPANAGRFQSYMDFVKHWREVGFVIQGTQVSGGKGKPDLGPALFVEVQSQFKQDKPPVQPWPTAATPAAPPQTGIT
jgi:L-Lysine epsilon oxidase N-terminal/L-lysine epsilon oxidase C-terminal domain